jgi:hypothetical protein
VLASVSSESLSRCCALTSSTPILAVKSKISPVAVNPMVE